MLISHSELIISPIKKQIRAEAQKVISFLSKTNLPTYLIEIEGITSIFSPTVFSQEVINHYFLHANTGEVTTGYTCQLAIFNELSDSGKTICTVINADHIDLIADAFQAGFIFGGLTSRIDESGNIIDLVQLVISNNTHSHSHSHSHTPHPFVQLPDGGISDGTLTLRITDKSDSLILYQNQYDPVTRHWSIYPDKSYEAIEKEAKLAKLKWLLGEKMSLTIFENVSGNAVGYISLRPVIPPKVADVGYGIFLDYRGLGYASRALNIFTEWAFNSAGFVRIELGVKAGNIASKKAAIKAGYIQESICQGRLINSDGTFSDQLSFIKLNPVITRS
ncbi:GNAT family N-acetyltransferase [Xenorhabdus kozodoii]|uniref:Acetyltransferase n=1 Tax=Xenorhabdus kozodoii TaxID=351676 RepID=A0A2D0L2V2_9GAMM|nr:GNAT family N-acetyltransferase [Xenorhabdus kozodoii]PHM70008.1 acetyltransferase [Xenorhabdus kozodoii]